MHFFQKKLNGIDKRVRCIRYGIFYFRNKNYKVPNFLLINGARINFDFKKANIHEFEQICLYDCYNLAVLKRKIKRVNNIVDIGANHGLFLIAARQYFPKATINCYEPNISLKESLSYNAQQLKADVHYEAVLKNDCMVELSLNESDLSTKTIKSNIGTIPAISFKRLIQRVGTIDILKIDCEGAEWELLEDIELWKNIKAVTMEYHLMGGYDLKILLKLFQKISFRLIHHRVLTSNQGVIVAINNID